MEEIKLYHKVWMALPPLLILLGLSIVAIIPLSQGKGPLFWNCFLLLLSGGFFLWGLSVLIRERVLHKHAIIITDDKLIVGKKEYHFADIHHFDLAYLSKSEAKGMDRIGRKINRILMGAEDCIQVTNLTMKPEKLCNLLNKRLK